MFNAMLKMVIMNTSSNLEFILSCVLDAEHVRICS